MPPIRFNGLVNPYINSTGAQVYTTSQLDMRRKAEILQYNKSASQTNKLTKSQKFAQAIGRTVNTNTSFIGTIIGNALIVSYVTQGKILVGQSILGFGVAIGTIILGQSTGVAGNIGTYTINISQNITTATVMRANAIISATNCVNDLYVPSLSSSCDVPGPVITLRYDPTVPLYNYAQNVASLGLINSENTNQWTDSTSNNIIAYDSIETTLVDIAIGNISSQTTTFSINSPIGIYVDGTSASSSPGDISISSVTIAVYYNDTNYLLTSVAQPTITATTDLKTARFTRIASSPFSGVIYVGNLGITNLTLPTMYGYVYKIKVKFNMTSGATGINKRVYMNVTNGTTTNCTLVTTSNPSPQIPYSLSGV
jgi:hypothetical protein